MSKVGGPISIAGGVLEALSRSDRRRMRIQVCTSPFVGTIMERRLQLCRRMGSHSVADPTLLSPSRDQGDSTTAIANCPFDS